MYEPFFSFLRYSDVYIGGVGCKLDSALTFSKITMIFQQQQNRGYMSMGAIVYLLHHQLDDNNLDTYLHIRCVEVFLRDRSAQMFGNRSVGFGTKLLLLYMLGVVGGQGDQGVWVLRSLPARGASLSVDNRTLEVCDLQLLFRWIDPDTLSRPRSWDEQNYLRTRCGVWLYQSLGTKSIENRYVRLRLPQG